MKIITLIGIVLIVGHLIPEFGELLEKFKATKGLGELKINPFWDKGYVFPVYEGEAPGIKLKWFISYWGTDFLFIIAFGLLAYSFEKFSYKLFLIGGIYLLYHIFDHLMLWWDFKSTHWLQWVAHGVNITATLILIFKKEKHQAILKSIN